MRRTPPGPESMIPFRLGSPYSGLISEESSASRTRPARMSAVMEPWQGNAVHIAKALGNEAEIVASVGQE